MEDVEGKIFLDADALNFYACFQGNFEITDYDNINGKNYIILDVTILRSLGKCDFYPV